MNCAKILGPRGKMNFQNLPKIQKRMMKMFSNCRTIMLGYKNKNIFGFILAFHYTLLCCLYFCFFSLDTLVFSCPTLKMQVNGELPLVYCCGKAGYLHLLHGPVQLLLPGFSPLCFF